MLKCKDKKWYQFWWGMTTTFHRLIWTHRALHPSVCLFCPSISSKPSSLGHLGFSSLAQCRILFLPQFKGGTEGRTGEKDNLKKTRNKREQINGVLFLCSCLSVHLRSSLSSQVAGPPWNRTWRSSILFCQNVCFVLDWGQYSNRGGRQKKGKTKKGLVPNLKKNKTNTTDYQKCKKGKEKESKCIIIYINLINVQHCIHFCVTRTRGRDDEEGGEGRGRKGRRRDTGSAATVAPPLCRESQGYKQVPLMYTGWSLQTLLCILQTFKPSVSARLPACVCVRECACVSFYFLAIPLFVVCCFLLCLYNWKISYFSIVVTLDDIWFCWNVEKKNVLWLLSNGLNILCFVFFFSWWKKGLDSKWRARI